MSITLQKIKQTQPNLLGVLKNKAAQLATGLALLTLGAWLEWRLGDGTLSYYLHPRFNLLIGFTGLIVGGLGVWLLLPKSRYVTPENSPLKAFSGITLVALVALFGLIVLPRPLDGTRAALVSGTGANSGGSSNRALAAALLKQDWNNAASLDTVSWNLLDWSAALNDPQRAEKLIDHPFDVTGFVILPVTTSSRNFLVARYVVVCCTADANALRVPVVSEKAQEVEAGQWVRVRGTLGRGSNGIVSFLANSVEIVARPANPYINP